MASMQEMLMKVSVLAKAAGLTIEKYAEAVVSWEKANMTERSTKDERLATIDALRSIVEGDPNGVFDARQVVVQVGLKQCQADRAFVRHHLEKLRLEHKKAA